MQILTYLASPYSHEDYAVETHRFTKVCQAAAHFIGQGLIVFSPISMSHPIHENSPDLDGSWETWSRQDYTFLDFSTQV